MNLLSSYKTHSILWTIFHHLKHDIVIANDWVIDPFVNIFNPLEPSHWTATRLVRTAVMVTSSWPGQDVTREHSELNTSRLLRVTATAELKMAWRRYPCVCRLLAPHDSRFPRTTVGASAVTPRTCDGLTLTRGAPGDKMYAEHHGTWIIFKWCALNFKTTQNWNKLRCLHPIP